MENETSASDDFKQKLMKGLELSFARLLEENRLKGQKLVMMIDEEIVELTVEEYEQARAEGRI